MSSKIKILSVAGARPNFVKVAALVRAFKRYLDDFNHLLCHTGQHYDFNMSNVFFNDLDLPEPDFFLGAGSGSHAEQTSKIMLAFEKVMTKENPDLIMVYGDVNSTLACGLVATKMQVPVAHVEAGLRSFDSRMPEETNRILTDRVSDYLFVSEKSGLDNLKNEGFSLEKKNSGFGMPYHVGNVMIDSLIQCIPRAESSKVLENLKLKSGEYVLVTLHRPENVDQGGWLSGLVSFLERLSGRKKVVFPVHPRTRKQLEKLITAKTSSPDLLLVDPLGYMDFLKLMKESALVITDSGGIQEETTFLEIQCVTVRNNTERPVTVDIGTNHMAGTDLKKVEAIVNCILDGKVKKGKIPILWDGRAGERIVEILKKEVGR